MVESGAGPCPLKGKRNPEEQKSEERKLSLPPGSGIMILFSGGLDGLPRVGRMDEVMAYKGIIKGRMIELEAFPPFRDGQPVRVSIEPFGGDGPTSSPAEVRRVMYESPHLCGEDVQELERAIGAGRLPMSDGSIFTGK
jgi:hypothetical protein